MTPPPDALLSWALSALGAQESRPELAVVAGDASNRRYFRFVLAGQSYVLALAPPATENNAAFVAVRDLLQVSGVRVPALYAADLERGYLLLEDLGNALLLPALNAATVDEHYRSAFVVLQQMAAADTSCGGLASYDRTLLGEELGRFAPWFAQGLLGHSPDSAGCAVLEGLFARLIDSALEQPPVLVHRDFHSRNLMLGEDGALAVIDFQDAVVGPVTYDLVSLLRDCYIQWPPQRVRDWALAYRDALVARGRLAPTGDALFLRWFDWMGLQRHIKVLGTFARLYLRDGKSAYLRDLPLVLHYVQEIVASYAPAEPAFAAFGQWYDSHLSPLVANQDWSTVS